MSRAFVSEDGPTGPAPRFHLPARDDPGYDAAAARVLIDAAGIGETAAAEDATGFAFGSTALVPDVLLILGEARRRNQDRLEQLAERFLRQAGEAIPE